MSSIEKTPYGTWRARWRANGRSHAKSFERKHEARAYLDSIAGKPSHVVDGKITVAAWADLWLAGARNLGRGGQDTYRRDLDRYILPAIGHLEMRHVTAETIDRYITDRLAHLATSTVHRHYRTLNRMFRVAVERRRLHANPCDIVQPPRVVVRDMRFLTVAEVDALAETITPRYRAWVYVAAYGGLRWSETVGLRTVNVDVPRIKVVEQLIRRRDGKWHRDEPKTKAGKRTVVLPASVGVELATHLERFPGELVFANRAGNPTIGPSFRQSIFQPAVARAGLGQVRIHDLRHTAVALAIAAGAHPKAIQARMGHASITVTLDRYGHLYESADDQVAAALDLLRG